MESPWVEVRAGGRAVRRQLGPRPMGIGPGGELADSQAPGERLVLFPDPLRAVFEGRGERPRLRGRELGRAALARGDAIRWRGMEIRIGPSEAALEVLPADELPGPGSAAWKRIKAGILVELDLAESGAARRAQEGVLARAFDADAAAAEILRLSPTADDDARLGERSARLMRDLVMSPLQRGSAGTRRRLRRAAASGFAWLILQFVVVGLVAALLVLALLAARARWKVSVDGGLDRVLELFGIG